MPQLATPITDAIDGFHTNEYVLGKAFTAITPEESLRQPAPDSNHALWILGHLINCRNSVMRFLGQPPASSQAWLPLFDRGAELQKDTSVYPSWNELLEIWPESTAALHKALNEASEEVLDSPSPEGVPSVDKKMSGAVRFFVIHEAYHTGQLGYLTTWLGHEGLIG